MPNGLFSNLEGIKTSGELAYHFLLDIDFARLDSLKFESELKEKDFPVDAERLIGNYFRVAQKDPDGSFNALVKNPAMFSPIEFEKIRPKFFGLIKVTPEDGIKANQKIGHFIKKLKV